jgi:hypothetical protein
VLVSAALVLLCAFFHGAASEVSARSDVPFDERFIAKLGFSSSLPLLLIDAKLNGGNEQMAVISVHDEKTNGLEKQPSFQFQAFVTRDGDFESKSNYKLKLAATSDEKLLLLGLRPESEWTLDGMKRNKSLLRHYLAHTLASAVMPETPQARHCKIFIREDDEYRYEGLYLLVENSSVRRLGKNLWESCSLLGGR